MGIDVGGDDSVRWQVDVRNARYQDVISRPDPVPPKGVGPYLNIGVDDTGKEMYVYTVMVKIPREGAGMARNAKAQFAASLTAAAQQARDAVKDPRITSVFFQLPVEDKAHGGANHHQLHIDWNSGSSRAAAIPKGKAATTSARGRGRGQKPGR
jgi:hypothetical protein